MTRKLLASGLLIVCVGLLAVRVSSQDPPAPMVPEVPGLRPILPEQAGVAGDASLEQLVQMLNQVRARKAELDKQERDLVARITKKVQEQRQQLDRIEALLREYQANDPRWEKTKTDLDKGKMMDKDKDPRFK